MSLAWNLVFLSYLWGSSAQWPVSPPSGDAWSWCTASFSPGLSEITLGITVNWEVLLFSPWLGQFTGDTHIDLNPHSQKAYCYLTCIACDWSNRLLDIKPVIGLPELFIYGKNNNNNPQKINIDFTGVSCESWPKDFSILRACGGKFTFRKEMRKNLLRPQALMGKRLDIAPAVPWENWHPSR